MSIRPVKRIVQATPTLEGAGVKLRRAFGFGETEEFDPFLLLDDFRNDEAGRLPRGIPVASAPRHRDDHLRPRWHGRAQRQPRQLGRARRGRRAMDDVRQRDPPSGDAEGRPERTHARIPALGESSVAPEDDARRGIRTCKSKEVPEVIDDDGTRVRVVCGDFWGKTDRSTASPPTPATSTCTCRRARAKSVQGRDRAPRVRVRVRGERVVPRFVRAIRRAHREGRTGRDGRARADGQPFARAVRSR